MKTQESQIENTQEKNSKTRKQREKFAMEIRDKDRNALFNSKRFSHKIQDKQQFTDLIPKTLPQNIQQFLIEHYQKLPDKLEANIQDILFIQEAIQSQDLLVLHSAVVRLRLICTQNNLNLIQQVIDCNLVAKLIQIINENQIPLIVFEAIWSLTNISGSLSQHTASVVEKGGIPLFLKLLNSNFLEIQEQALLAIGNMAAVKSEYRDFIIKEGTIDKLIQILQANNQNSLYCIWALSNLCRGKPNTFDQSKNKVVSIFCQTLISLNDLETIINCCWALSYLSELDENIDIILNSQVIQQLVNLLDRPEEPVFHPILRIFGNIFAYDNYAELSKYSMEILNYGLLNKLLKYLFHEKKSVKREVCWLLSNIATGRNGEICTLIHNTQLIDKILMMMTSETLEVMRETLYCIKNCIKYGTLEDIDFLVQRRLLENLISLLTEQDQKILIITLKCIQQILNKGDQFFQDDENYYLNIFEQCGANQKIENLQQNPSEKVYKLCFAILDQYYDTEQLI